MANMSYDEDNGGADGWEIILILFFVTLIALSVFTSVLVTKKSTLWVKADTTPTPTSQTKEYGQ